MKKQKKIEALNKQNHLTEISASSKCDALCAKFPLVQNVFARVAKETLRPSSIKLDKPAYKRVPHA